MIRKNVQLSNYLADKLVIESKRLGISQSSLMSIALDNYFRLNFDEKNKAETSKNTSRG